MYFPKKIFWVQLKLHGWNILIKSLPTDQLSPTDTSSWLRSARPFFRWLYKETFCTSRIHSTRSRRWDEEWLCMDRCTQSPSNLAHPPDSNTRLYRSSGTTRSRWCSDWTFRAYPKANTSIGRRYSSFSQASWVDVYRSAQRHDKPQWSKTSWEWRQWGNLCRGWEEIVLERDAGERGQRILTSRHTLAFHVPPLNC